MPNLSIPIIHMTVHAEEMTFRGTGAPDNDYYGP